MADNVEVTPGFGKTIATDEIGSAHYQVIKTAFGADGVATLVSSDDPYPVAINGVYNTTLPTFTNGQNGDLQIGTRGSLHCELWVSDSNQPITTVASNADGQSAGANATRLEVVSRDSFFNGSTWDRMRGDTTNGLDVDVTRIAAGTNSIGNVGLVPRTSGGLSIFRSIDIDETEEEIKATAGQLFSISAFNMTDAPLFLKFYNATAANVTVGTTTPVLTFPVPGNAASDGAGLIWNNDIGFAFGTAMTVACTTAVADNDTGTPTANACIVNVGYA